MSFVTIYNSKSQPYKLCIKKKWRVWDEIFLASLKIAPHLSLIFHLTFFPTNLITNVSSIYTFVMHEK